MNLPLFASRRDSGVRFVAVDTPGANDLTVGIMALFAQAEPEAISRRMKEALANGAESLRGLKKVALRSGLPSRQMLHRLRLSGTSSR